MQTPEFVPPVQKNGAGNPTTCGRALPVLLDTRFYSLFFKDLFFAGDFCPKSAACVFE